MLEKLPLVLYIEDDPAHTEIFIRSVRRKSLKADIVHFEEGQKALDYLLRKGIFSDPESSPRPALIVTDLRLPKIDGLELIESVRSNDQLSNIPIIVLTTSASEEDIVRAYDKKANSYLVKPFDCNEYMALIELFYSYWLQYNRFATN